MSNKDIVKAFYEHKTAKSNNLTSIGNKLISYNTCIAERITVEGIVLIIKNVTKYSSSTAKHQSYINKYNCVTTDKVPINTANLKKYIDNEWLK